MLASVPCWVRVVQLHYGYNSVLLRSWISPQLQTAACQRRVHCVSLIRLLMVCLAWWVLQNVAGPVCLSAGNTGLVHVPCSKHHGGIAGWPES